ncbi:MAG: MFS transporter [Sulfolobales archaeon]
MIISYSSYNLAYASYSYSIRYFALDLGLNYSAQSIYDTLGNIVSVIIVLLIGITADYLGRIRTATITTLISLLSPLLSLTRDPSLGVPLSIVIYNVSFAAGVVARNLLMIELGGEILGRLIGLVMTVGALSMIIGPVVGLWIKDLAGYRVLFVFITLLYASSSTSLYMIRFRLSEIRYSEYYRDPLVVLRDLKSTIFSRDPYTSRLFVFVIIDRFSYSMWAQMIYALIASEDILLSTSAYLATTMNLAWFLSQYIFGFMSDRYDPAQILRFSEFITGVTALSLAFSLYLKNYVILYLAFILLGISISSWIPSYNKFFQLYILPEKRAVFMSYANIYALLLASPSPYIGSLTKDLILPNVSHLCIASIIHIANAILTLSKRASTRLTK